MLEKGSVRFLSHGAPVAHDSIVWNLFLQELSLPVPIW